MIVAAVEVEAHSGATVLDQKDHRGQERPDRTSEIVAEVVDLEEGKENFVTYRFFTDSQRSCGKVMFSQACVIPSTGGVSGIRSFLGVGYLWSHIHSGGTSRPRRGLLRRSSNAFLFSRNF